MKAELIFKLAEFRGPGVHHNFDDSDSGYDVDMDQKSKTFGGGNQRGGRIILLGDGTEVLTDSDDTEMFDHSEEDRDLASQVHKGQVTGHGQPTEDKKSAILPEKLDAVDAKYKAVADKVLTNSTVPKPVENGSDTKDK
jgi:protein phosphatase 2C family protein 2/3